MRPTRAIIHPSAISENLRLARRAAPSGRLLFVIKADAYGHGAARVAAACEGEADAFAVAFLDEAVALRASGVEKPILTLQGPFSEDEARAFAGHGLWPLVHRRAQIEWLAGAASTWPCIWLKIDTGMHRLGLTPDDAAAALAQLGAASLTRDVVVMTHLSHADVDDETITRRQIERYDGLSFDAAGIDLSYSLANSAGLERFPDARRRWNRVGYLAFGGRSGGAWTKQMPALAATMTLSTRIIALRDVPAGDGVGYGASWRADRPSRIATLPIGYADGYPRHMPSGSPVLVNGARARLVGRVSMDLITIDVTDLGQPAAIGDEVVLWGKDLPIDAVALHAGTIGYELMTRVGARVPRIYDGDFGAA